MKLYLLFCSLRLCSFHVLGSAGQSLQQEFYTISGLAEEINRSAFFSLDHVPDHRLRPMIHILFCHLLQFISCCHPFSHTRVYKIFFPISVIWTKMSYCFMLSENFLNKLLRVFLRQLVLSCPQEYYDSLLCPLLGPLFAYMQQVRIVPFCASSISTSDTLNSLIHSCFSCQNSVLLLFHNAETQR